MLKFVHEVILAGSQGILPEAVTIAEESYLRFELADRLLVNVWKSAGLAMVILKGREGG